jgi:hypothetical protein
MPRASTNAERRRQRRARQALSARVDQELDADRNFFERFPGRRFRMRRCFGAEQIEFESVGGAFPCEPDLSAFVVVANVRAGCRLRFPLFAPSALDADALSEATCEDAFNDFAPDWIRDARQAILENE